MGAPIYGRLEFFAFFFCKTTSMSIKFLVLGGGGILGLRGGGEVPILLLWARGFFWAIPYRPSFSKVSQGIALYPAQIRSIAARGGEKGRGPWWVARLKISFSRGNSNRGGRSSRAKLKWRTYGDGAQSAVCFLRKFTRPQLGPFFVLKFVRSRSFGARFLQPFPKPLVTVKYYLSTKMAVNSR